MPLTNAARKVFRRQMEETPGTEYLFPSPITTGKKPHMTNLRKVWADTLKKSGRTVFRALRASAHVRYAAQRGRRRRSHGDANVAAERRGGVFKL